MLETDIEDSLLTKILFDTTRYFDKQLTSIYKREQKNNNRIFNTIERKALRNYFYYGNEEILLAYDIQSFPTINYTLDDIDMVCKDIIARLKTYDSNQILNSIKQKYINIQNHNISTVSFKDEWMKYYESKRQKLFDYSSIILKINQEDFKNHDYNNQYIFNLIASLYNKLENYRYMFLVFDGQIFDKNNNDITWKTVYQTTLYAENFIQYQNKYYPFKKKNQIKVLQDFINNRFPNNPSANIAEKFYEGISTGYKFEDCFIEKNQNTIIVTLKKIYHDETAVPCPSCMSTHQAKNSYPEMFLRSFECLNPNCQDRSKSGRGKRFDEYSVYRNFKLEENNNNNKITNELYGLWRRDIFNENANWLEMILKYYTWGEEKILTYNIIDHDRILYNRNVFSLQDEQFTLPEKYSKTYSDLPIVQLFTKIFNLIDKTIGRKKIGSTISINYGNSSLEIKRLLPNQVGTAITSPPYYNAREYSQWKNLLLYLIDMMINATAVYNTLTDNANYLYNIGDIVGEDNIYITSQMSNRRLPLGFLSCMIFEIIGFNLVENIIWDKGEVQSKRNSTVNLFSGYVKCINCYEHIFVFNKNGHGSNHKKIAEINPVFKINSKGENIYNHTAPYPIKLVNLVNPYLQKDKYLLDPFLGSGTTLLWCKQNNKLGIGYEINENYYNLANKNLKKEDE